MWAVWDNMKRVSNSQASDRPFSRYQDERHDQQRHVSNSQASDRPFSHSESGNLLRTRRFQTLKRATGHLALGYIREVAAAQDVSNSQASDRPFSLAYPYPLAQSLEKFQTLKRATGHLAHQDIDA